ncbi:MAG: cupredoxin family copper-binding protein [Patescibacteria group bacterium]|nr:cupredoxin family copper-binding protein [Patescibacteria group bacterium]MDE2437950.1 cupredoxin family copper-binding protein [Patescibacteria group bacterium]
MKKIFIGVVVVVILVALFFVLKGSSRGTSKASPSSPYTEATNTLIPQPQTAPSSFVSVSTSTVSQSSQVTVIVKNFAFNPSMLTIKRGTRVTWVNNDNVSHTVTSDDGNLFNSGTLAPGRSFSFTFTTVGTMTYHCGVHPSMKGQIVVE